MVDTHSIVNKILGKGKVHGKFNKHEKMESAEYEEEEEEHMKHHKKY